MALLDYKALEDGSVAGLVSGADGELSGPFEYTDASKTGFGFSNLAFNTNSKTFELYNTSDVIGDAEENLPVIADNSFAAVGYSQLRDAIAASPVLKDAVSSMIEHGFGLLVDGLDNVNQADFDAIAFNQQLKAFLKGAYAGLDLALITTTLFPGDPAAEAVADQILNNIRFTASAVPDSSGISGDVDLSLAVTVDSTALPVTLTGTEYSDVIIDNRYKSTLNGLGGNDVLIGGGGVDTLDGGEGNDVLDGGVGQDKMTGGNGDDIYYVDKQSDRIVEKPNEGFDKVYTTSAYSLQNTAVEDMELIGTANHIRLTGNELNNTITGNFRANILDGARGDDTLIGGDGDDAYYVDSEFDRVIEKQGEGLDTIYSSVSYSLQDASDVEALIVSGLAISVTGNDLDNSLSGNKNANILDGKAGADTMTGGQGNDTYYVDNVADKVVEYAYQGSDIIYSSVSYSVGNTHVEQLELTGTADINASGNTFNNILIGNSGNNTLDGKKGTDSMFGGLGDDTYYVDDASDRIIENENEGQDKVFSSISYDLTAKSIERLQLTGNQAINATGNSSDNLLTGNNYNNILDGKSGNDTLSGLKGNDTYYVDSRSDRVLENRGEGTDHIYSSVSYSLKGTFVEVLELTGTGDINAIGNGVDNTLKGNSGNNILKGQGGTDTLAGAAGNDTYYVDSSDDLIIEGRGEGVDIVYSAAASYSIDRTFVEQLQLTGNTNSNAYGNNLANLLTGNSGNNILDGKAGADTLTGGKGDDTYYVDSLSDRVLENRAEGTDRIYSSVSYDLKGTYVEHLQLTGTAGLNAVGNGLNNILTGNSGNNVLKGQAGADVYAGHAGSDTATYDVLLNSDARGGNGTDTWADFKVGNTLSDADADKIDIANLLIGYSGDGSAASLSAYVQLVQSGDNTVLRIDRDGAGSTFGFSSLLSLNSQHVDLATLISNQQLVV